MICDGEKVCTWCKSLKPLPDFPKDRTKRDGYSARCKLCKRTAWPTNTYDPTDEKRCRGCGHVLPGSAFCRDRNSKDGLFHLCRGCLKGKLDSGEYARSRRTPEQRAEYARRSGRVDESIPYVPRAERKRVTAVRRRERKAAIAVALFIRAAFRKRKPIDRSKVRGTPEWYAAATPEEAAAYKRECRDKYRQRYRERPAEERRRTKRYKLTHPDVVSMHHAERRNRIETGDDGTLTHRALSLLFDRAKACPYCGCMLHARNKMLDHIIPLARGGRHSITNVLVCCAPCNMSKGARLLCTTVWQPSLRAA